LQQERLPLHPSPGRPEAERNAQHQQRRAPENAGVQRMIEPSSDEEADQSRRDDDPAENADLADKPHHRRLAFSPPTFPALLLFSHRVGHPVRRIWFALDGVGIHHLSANMPGRSGRR
jgi:hypothetical protein